ncbi:MAG TPA: 3-hydroxy-5-phosphonooxypentane-2,4-dione thiolase [Phycisphaerae bacterium]|nr:3-hydroxy-5-phosphonooxypentane-2,4-dione thiolase [Phycisphaerae bacterium]
MPGPGSSKGEKNFHVDVPMKTDGFFLRGSNALDWGMKNRLSRIFNPKSGRTVMLAFDHGYLMGPTSGLERMDLSIVPLMPYVDCLMCTRGALRTCMPPETDKPVCLRVSAGATILKDDMTDECIGVDVDDAIRLNVSAMAVQCYVGGVHERQTLDNLSRVINAGNRYGIPTLGVTAVGKEMARDARYLGMASRVLAELGAHYIKTYFCAEKFEDVVAGCPVPIVIAGGKKIPERDAIEMAHQAIDQGALGVDMGRNIFCAEDPVAMVRAVQAVVHEDLKPAKAYEMYQDLKSGKKSGKKG